MKAIISIAYNGDDVIAIRDMDGKMSITNDAEGVVAFLASRHFLTETKKLIYRDSMGFWDELVHNGKELKGFKPIRTKMLYEAIAKVLDTKTEYVVSITDYKGGRPVHLLYIGKDYQKAFDTAVEARDKEEWRGKWVKFINGETIKWAQIS